MAKHISGFLWSSSEWTVSFLSNGRLQSILFCGASDQHVSKSRHSCYGSNTLIFRQYQGIKKRQWPPIFQPRVRRIRQILRFPSPSNNATVAKRKRIDRTFHENYNEESPCSIRGREVLQTASILVPESVQIHSTDYHQKNTAELLFGAPRSFHTRLPELIDERQASDEVKQTNKTNRKWSNTQSEGITRQLHSWTSETKSSFYDHELTNCQVSMIQNHIPSPRSKDRWSQQPDLTMKLQEILHTSRMSTWRSTQNQTILFARY